METTVSRERLEITIRPAAKRVLMRWARRMNVSAGELLEYCFLEQQSNIREGLASLEDDIRDRSDSLTDGSVADLAFEAFGEEILGAKGPV